MKKRSDIKTRVKQQYAEVVAKDDACCDGLSQESLAHAEVIGYSEQEIMSLPAEEAVTHGCGNPTAIAELKEGETVLDLGCGGGLDVFLAVKRVGSKGKVIGLDMTPEMIDKARAIARTGNYTNVEFLVAEIEKLPISNESVDVIISNCVINHSPDKLRVFREAYRVLKPGGRMFVSDLVTAGKLPEEVLRNADKLWTDWLTAATDKHDYLNTMEVAGFQAITVVAEGTFPLSEADNVLRGKIISIQVKGTK